MQLLSYLATIHLLKSQECLCPIYHLLPSVHYTAWTDEDQRHFFLPPWSNFVWKTLLLLLIAPKVPMVSSVPSVCHGFRLVSAKTEGRFLAPIAHLVFPCLSLFPAEGFCWQCEVWNIWSTNRRVPAVGYRWGLLCFIDQREPRFLLHATLGNKRCRVQEERSLSNRFAVNGKWSSCILPTLTSLSWGCCLSSCSFASEAASEIDW